jgi:DNA-directed RNA polymerase III subunit RPC6
MPPKRTTSAIVPGITKRRAIQVGASTRVAVSVKNEDPTTEDAVSQLREEFVNLLQQHKNEITNSKLKDTFGARYSQLPTIINGFSKEGRLTMMKDGDELVYRLASAEEASKFSGLDVAARMVYQIIEKAGNKGIWTKDIRVQSNIQQQALNKIFKQLENRQLIKPLKSVAAKAKKLYILYDLTPAKEVTGGPWYTGMSLLCLLLLSYQEPIAYSTFVFIRTRI